MARAVWSGAISFGLVNVPVKAYTAVRDHEVHFHQLERRTGSRIHMQKISEKTGKPVDNDDLELGYELSRGRYVTVDPDELDALRPRTTRTIDISDFVALTDIDPIYYEHTYWLAPADEAAAKPYRLLVSAMEARGRVGIGAVVMRRKQYLGAVRPLDGALALSTMRFADEIVDRGAIDAIPSASKAKPDAKELKLAETIVESLTEDWDPERYRDSYTDELKTLIARKASGEEITVQESAPETTNVVDLMAALEASVTAAKETRKRHPTARPAEQPADGEAEEKEAKPARPAKKAAPRKRKSA